MAMTVEIMDIARAHLAEEGAAALSLRAIARELGMSSSAVYRYVASRDELLTVLIVEAYDSLGVAAEEAEAVQPRHDHAGRFRAIAHAVRRWAVENEHEYALVYGSPVPGYQAPQTTIEPATRVPALLIDIIADALAAGWTPDDLTDLPGEVIDSLGPVRDSFRRDGSATPPDLVARGLMAWTYLFGAVSFDLFGHRRNVITNERAVTHAFFEYEVDRLIRLVGFATDG
jgi:AcrR family transcriptional regulator